MKTKISDSNPTDDIQPEYDFTGAVRGKYASQLKEEGYTIREYAEDGTYSERHVLGDKVVTLDPDVWEYFPDSASVNRALHALITALPLHQQSAA